jgi:hypothetical protein
MCKLSFYQIFKDCFSENTGISSMRIFMMISLLVASTIAFIGLYKGSDLANLSILCSVFLGTSIGGKVMQKRSEVSLSQTRDNNVINRRSTPISETID